jgi:hypothetical protein
VTEFALLDMRTLADDWKAYGVVLKGWSGSPENVQEVGVVLDPVITGVLLGNLARLAVTACDDDFLASLLVGLTETKAESQQHLSQFLGHGEDEGE